MKRLLRLGLTLLAAITLFVTVSATNYFLGFPNRTLVYVSSVNYGGVPAGNDVTGTGTASNPYESCDAGLSAAASNNATVRFNGNPSSPTLYRCSLGIAKGLTVEAVNTLGAKLAGTTVTAALNISVSNGETVTIRNLIIAPDENLAGPAAYALFLATPTTRWTLNLTGNIIQNWTDTGVKLAGTNAKLDFNSTSNTYTTTTANNGVNIGSLHTGDFRSTDDTIVITNQQAANIGGNLNVVATQPTGVTAIVTRLNSSMTVDPSLPAVQQHFGNRILGVPNAVFDGGTQSCDVSNPSTHQCVTTGFQRSATLSVSGSVIRNVTCSIHVANNSGGCLENSTDSVWTDRSLSDGVIIEDNIVQDLGDPSGTTHTIGMFVSQNSIVRRNTFIGGALCAVMKSNVDLLVHQNTLSDCGSKYLYDKGSHGTTFSSNVVNITTGFPGTGITCGTNAGGGYDFDDCSGGTSSANTLNYNGAINAVLVSVGSGQSMTFANNVYNYNSGTRRTTDDWFYDPTAYADLAAWQVKEPTATGTYP